MNFLCEHIIMASGFLQSHGLNVNKSIPSHSLFKCRKIVFSGHLQIWLMGQTMICILIKINDYKCTVLVCLSNT